MSEPAGLGGALPPRPKPHVKADSQPPPQRLHAAWAKVSLGNDLRLVPFPADEGLLGLRAAIARKARSLVLRSCSARALALTFFSQWPDELVPLIVKSHPPNGEQGVTIDSDAVLHQALSAWPPMGRVPRLRLVRPGTEGKRVQNKRPTSAHQQRRSQGSLSTTQACLTRGYWTSLRWCENTSASTLSSTWSSTLREWRRVHTPRRMGRAPSVLNRCLRQLRRSSRRLLRWRFSTGSYRGFFCAPSL